MLENKLKRISFGLYFKQENSYYKFIDNPIGPKDFLDNRERVCVWESEWERERERE